MLRQAVTLLLTLCAALAAAAAAETPSPVTEEIALARLDPRDVMTALRSMAGTRRIEAVDEHTLRITDTPATIELARLVVDLAENPDTLGEAAVHTLADGSALVCVALRHASIRDAMTALRAEVAVKRVAGNDTLASVMVRDTPAQVAASLAVLRRLDAAAGTAN